MENKEENSTTYLQLESEILKVIKEVFDPEIPVNVYDLGLIYEIDVDDYNNVDIKMTLTAPNCPVADSMPNEVKEKVKAVEGVNNVNIEMVFDPPWSASMMSEEAKLVLGYL
ncbi:MAG: SUF system Fe-S cluster assembly protein [Bacteroidetes bacterium]|nr:MAG: SUF system Fe-S cluster assembly protein [Bacteroidota bacterium]RLD80673.1 MAG: SUF system Fe-S cluster assembly protein [Bacteroidota bacterium]